LEKGELQNMMGYRKNSFLFILIIGMILVGVSFCSFSVAFAEAEKRTISLEWESVLESHGYQLEVVQILKSGERKAPLLFKTDKNSWSGKITPGNYEFRLKSSDQRGVYGEWSPSTAFVVQPPAVVQEFPLIEQQIQTNEDKEYSLEFKWTSSSGAELYQFELYDENNKLFSKQQINETQIKINLPVAKKYLWRVLPLVSNKSENTDEPPTSISFLLIGKEIKPPEIKQPESKFTSELRWTEPDFAKSYSYKLSRKNGNKGWVKVIEVDESKPNTYAVDPKIKGGHYLIEVTAHSPHRLDSQIAKLEFDLYDGDRSAEGMNRAMLRETLDKMRNQYFIASYLISNLSYLGINKELGSNSRYQALSGTGRLGYGYSPQSAWGFTAIVDYSGVIINKKNYTYPSMEFAIQWRKYLLRATRVQVFGGIFTRELPEVFGGTAADSVEVQNVGQAGPYFGFQVWQPLNRKLGLQLNAQTSIGMIKLKTPNGQSIDPSMSYQVGFLGSYKLSPLITGFAGYARRLDKISYKAVPYDGTSSQNFAEAGDVNQVSLTGDYLNLLLEWEF
jgi:hypothetical protein